jgi:di/tricarboxylate transporter
MWVFVNLAMLVLATVIAGAAAVAVYWLLLRATVEMMRPAVAPVVRLRKEGSK